MRGAPRLHDPLVWDQLDISSDDLSSEQGKGSPRFGVDLGRRTRECRELLCIQKHLIDALRAGLKLDILVQGCARLDWPRFAGFSCMVCGEALRKCTGRPKPDCKAIAIPALPPRRRGRQRSRASFLPSSRPPDIRASMHRITRLSYVQDHILLDERRWLAPYFGSQKPGELMPYPSGHRDRDKRKDHSERTQAVQPARL